MKQPGNDDWLDRILSEDTGYVDDDGFTEAVMRRLPARAPRRRPWRVLIMSAAALMSAAIWGLALPEYTALYSRLTEWLLSQPIIGWGALSITLCTASGIVAGWVLNLDR